MGKHARLSASAAHRWTQCPGSIKLVEELQHEGKILPTGNSEYAAEGTAAHTLIDWCIHKLLNGQWDISASEYADAVLIVDPKTGDADLKPKAQKTPKNAFEFVVDKEMIHAADQFIDHARHVLYTMGASEKGIPEHIRVDTEIDIDLNYLGNKALGGRLDLRISEFLGELHIIDYKHGVGVPVSPVNNQQLLYYAAGSEVMAENMPESVHLTIVQPRCPQVASVQTWAVSPLHVNTWVSSELLPAAEEALGDNPNLNPGEHQCKWCKAKAHCPEVQNLALAVARKEFDEEPEKTVTELPDADFIQLFSKVSLLRQVITALEDRALLELKSGKTLPGYKLVRSTSRRRWKTDAEQVLLSKKIPHKVLYGKKLVSFTELEKNEKYKKLVESLTEKPEGRPVVVRADDKRPEIQSVTQEFESLED